MIKRFDGLDTRRLTAQAFKAYKMIYDLVPLPEICVQTTYQPDTVRRMVNRVYGKDFRYPGKYCKRPETLCWSCGKAVARCSWSRFFIPVEGWNATATQIKSRNECGCVIEIDSFFVRECPEYVPDPPKGER